MTSRFASPAWCQLRAGWIFAQSTCCAGIIDKLNKEVNAGLAEPKLKTQLADLGGIILGGSSADFRTFVP
jgi:hypothetical protein